MSRPPFADVWDSIETINRHLREVRVVAWLMVGFAGQPSVGDLIQQDEVGEIGDLIGHLADDMKETAAKLEEQIDALRETT